MKLLRILMLLLLSTALPAYGWVGLHPTAPCPMETGGAAAAAQQQWDEQADHCPSDMDCCASPMGLHCQTGQDCHPAAVLAPLSEAGLPAAVPQRGVVAPACLGTEGQQTAPPLRPPRRT